MATCSSSRGAFLSNVDRGAVGEVRHPGDVAQVIHAGASRQRVIGGGLVDAPSGPSDPGGAEIVAQIAAGCSSAVPRPALLGASSGTGRAAYRWSL
jgi:hypothetical protein